MIKLVQSAKFYLLSSLYCESTTVNLVIYVMIKLIQSAKFDLLSSLSARVLLLIQLFMR